MKRYGLILGSIFILVLLAVIAFKLSEDAVAVIIGVGLGVLASVPTSLVIAFILTRQQNALGKFSNQPPTLPQSQHPPVVVVNGGQQQPGLGAGHPKQPYYQMPTPQRTFTVVGEETTEV